MILYCWASFWKGRFFSRPDLLASRCEFPNPSSHTTVNPILSMCLGLTHISQHEADPYENEGPHLGRPHRDVPSRTLFHACSVHLPTPCSPSRGYMKPVLGRVWPATQTHLQPCPEWSDSREKPCSHLLSKSWKKETWLFELGINWP